MLLGRPSLKKKFGIFQGGGGVDPISKHFQKLSDSSRNSIKEIKFVVSSYTLDTIWAISAKYGQILLFFVSIRDAVIKKKGDFPNSGGGPPNLENSTFFYF